MSKQLWDAIEKIDVDGAKSIINSITPEDLNRPVSDTSGRTVLQRAVSKGLTDIVQLIIDKNPDTLHYECSYGRLKGLSLLHFAVPNNSRAKVKTSGVEVAELLFNHPKYNSKAKAIFADKAASQEILKRVITEGLSDLCEWYFDKVPAVTTMVDDSGQTPLHWAILSNNIKLVKFFVDKMSDEEFNNFTGSLHPLRFSTSSKNEEITKLLLGKTSLEKLKSVDKHGSILHCAAKRGLIKFIDDILPKFSAEEIIATDISGHTPLYYAYDRDAGYCTLPILLPVTAKAYEYLLGAKGLTFGKLHPQVNELTSIDKMEMKALCNFAKKNGFNTLYEQLLPIISPFLTPRELSEIQHISVLKGQHEILTESIPSKLSDQTKTNDNASISEKVVEQTDYTKLKEEFEEYKKQASAERADLLTQLEVEKVKNMTLTEKLNSGVKLDVTDFDEEVANLNKFIEEHEKILENTTNLTGVNELEINITDL